MSKPFELRLEPSLLPMALQLYASATAAAAEFVALAWDSDAGVVDIQLLDDELRMSHDGHALSEAQLVKLLRVGRRDREATATALGRQRLTPGALGLLTYLGVARTVVLRTR